MLSDENGQTLLELIVVIGVAVIVIGALVFATISSLRNAQFAKNQSQATKLAQEGIERARLGRDRNQAIGGLGNVTSWNGGPSGNGAIWNYQINGNCGSTALNPPTYCYFNVTDQGVLNYLTASSSLPSAAEAIPPAPATAVFHRAIILSDDSSYQIQKTVTSLVQWTDFSGTHQSRLTTILGNASQ